MTLFVYRLGGVPEAERPTVRIFRSHEIALETTFRPDRVSVSGTSNGPHIAELWILTTVRSTSSLLTPRASWGPRTWQGWLIVALLTPVVVGITIFGTVQNS